MVSRGACSLSRSPRLAAPRRGRQQARTQRAERRGAAAPGPELARSCGPGHLRPAGAVSTVQVCLASVAHLARRQRWRQRRRLQPRARSPALRRGGFAAGPRSHFVFLCKSHESGFPRAGAVMPAAAGRARAPLCSAERAAVSSPGGAAPVSPQHTHTPRPDSPAAPRLPGLGALESAEFAEREPFKFSALGSLERGLRARKEDGGERWEGGGAARARGTHGSHPLRAVPGGRGTRC